MLYIDILTVLVNHDEEEWNEMTILINFIHYLHNKLYHELNYIYVFDNIMLFAI